MKIELRFIDREKYDDLLSSINENANFYSNIDYNDLFIQGEKVSLNDISKPLDPFQQQFIEVNEYDLDFSPSMMKWKENSEVGKMLHKKLIQYSNKFFGNLNEVYFWAYLCHTYVFKQYILKRYFEKENEDDEKNELPEKKISRYFFAKGTSSRTGIMFNWLLTDSTYDFSRKYDFTDIAFNFIDPVKAIYERSFHKNKFIVKAFVEGIEQNGCSTIFKNSKYKTLIPTHISNIAAINSLDSYTYYPELLEKISKEQKYMLDLYYYEKDSKLINNID